MRRFAQLYQRLDQTTKTNDKVEAMARYFAEAPPHDRLWLVALLSHRRPKRGVNTTLLRQWAAEYADTPQWLFEEAYHVVGDLAETIALALPPPTLAHEGSLSYWIDYLRRLSEVEEPERRERVLHAWRGLDKMERFVFNKLITGAFRVGVSQKLMTRALARYTGEDENKLAHRLMGDWSPLDTTFDDLLLHGDPSEDQSKPYPFYLAYALEEAPEQLGDPAEWQAEQKWDGIRGQLIVRKGELFLWSRGEELITNKFPEFHPLATRLPDGTVIDGEIMPWAEGRPLSFQVLQTRIGRKNLSKQALRQAPAIMMAYDLLEWQGRDLRRRPLRERRALLEDLLARHAASGVLRLSKLLTFEAWDQLQAERDLARQKGSEGLMLKRRESSYKSGRKKGDWWKWKIDPYTIDAVMIYAQRGHGRRANLYTDFTFAVWDGEELTPFAKAYSGLTDAEFQEITNWVRRNTLERFGPVRAVRPILVFEIAFEGIQPSARHKSGVALRFPRIIRWRRDKPAAEADTLRELRSLMDPIP
jgi:DNA ligase-1